jgi:hypothetical protein
MSYLADFEPGINLPSKNWPSQNFRTIELLLVSCDNNRVFTESKEKPLCSEEATCAGY